MKLLSRPAAIFHFAVVFFLVSLANSVFAGACVTSASLCSRPQAEKECCCAHMSGGSEAAPCGNCCIPNGQPHKNAGTACACDNSGDEGRDAWYPLPSRACDTAPQAVAVSEAVYPAFEEFGAILPAEFHSSIFSALTLAALRTVILLN